MLGARPNYGRRRGASRYARHEFFAKCGSFSDSPKLVASAISAEVQVGALSARLGRGLWHLRSFTCRIEELPAAC